MLETHTILITFGLFFDLIGGVLLASEMIGLLEKIKNYNLKLQKEIDSIRQGATILAIVVLVLILVKDSLKIKPGRQKKLGIQEVWEYIHAYILTTKFKIIYSLLLFLQNSTKKLGTERILGLLGVIFLCLGFIFQAIINFTAV